MKKKVPGDRIESVDDRAEKGSQSVSMSRRAVLKGAVGLGVMASAGTVGLQFVGNANAAIKPPKKWDKTADVIILGTGGAGLCAAVEAGRGRAKVLVLEKEPFVGGSTVICGGALAVGPTPLQKEKGISDSSELFYSDLMKVGKNKPIPELVRTYVDAAVELYNFLVKLGANFTGIENYPGMSVPRGHMFDPKKLIKILKDEAVKRGAEIITENPGKRLITNDQGRVVGVMAERKGKKAYYKASRAVILASGGFGRNTEMLDEFSDLPLGLCLPITAIGNTGDGHKMAMEIGASTKQISLGIGPSTPADFETKMITMPMYQGAVIVNKAGKRFVNESLSYLTVGKAALDQPEALIFQIADAVVYDAAQKNTLSNKGTPKKAETLEKLAEVIGVPPKALAETIDKYNSYVEAGKDPDFGRNTLVGVGGKPLMIKTPPFYAWMTKPAMVSTKGGLKINVKSQVIDMFGDVIPGIYAPGEVMGGFHGAGYMSGSAVGKALIFGRIAGIQAAAEKPWK